MITRALQGERVAGRRFSDSVVEATVVVDTAPNLNILPQYSDALGRC